jgi:hypothetical protein
MMARGDSLPRALRNNLSSNKRGLNGQEQEATSWEDIVIWQCDDNNGGQQIVSPVFQRIPLALEALLCPSISCLGTRRSEIDELGTKSRAPNTTVPEP